MVTKRALDGAVTGLSPSCALSFGYADVSETARELAVRHGASACASSLLAKMLAATALVSTAGSGTAALLRMSCSFDGPIGGFGAEMSGDGHLCGYVFEPSPETRRRLPENPEDSDVCGHEARVSISRHDERGELLDGCSFAAAGNLPQAVFLGAFAVRRKPVKIAVVSSEYNGRIDRARAFMMQCERSYGAAEFKRVAALFDDGTVSELLIVDPSLPSIREVLDVPDLTTGPTRAIALGCRCADTALDSFASEPEPTIAAWVRADIPQFYHCVFCGAEYEFSPETIIKRSLELKKKHPPS